MSADDSGFRARTVAIVVAIGVACALAFAVLSAFAAELRSGHDGGGHALSVSATGFSGIVELANASGMPTVIGRSESPPTGSGLLVLTPELSTDPAQLADMVGSRGDAVVLIVLPKWRTLPIEKHRSWVQQIGVLPPDAVAAAVAKVAAIGVAPATAPGDALKLRDGTRATRVPAQLQVLIRSKLEPVLVDGSGQIVIGKLPGAPVYVLADPDLLANHALADAATARAALDLLDHFASARGGNIVFDVSLNGYGVPRSLLRLALMPPFLALTASLLVAALLAGWQAALRFGDPVIPSRAIAFGKLALVDNGAALIGRARRVPAMAPRYAALMRDAAAIASHAPASVATNAVADWLDDRRGQGGAFAALAARAAVVQTPAETLAVAQALHRWKESRSHDSQ